jgi:hypothetical protein
MKNIYEELRGRLRKQVENLRRQAKEMSKTGANLKKVQESFAGKKDSLEFNNINLN